MGNHGSTASKLELPSCAADEAEEDPMTLMQMHVDVQQRISQPSPMGPASELRPDKPTSAAERASTAGDTPASTAGATSAASPVSTISIDTSANPAEDKDKDEDKEKEKENGKGKGKDSASTTEKADSIDPANPAKSKDKNKGKGKGKGNDVASTTEKADSKAPANPAKGKGKNKGKGKGNDSASTTEKADSVATAKPAKGKGKNKGEGNDSASTTKKADSKAPASSAKGKGKSKDTDKNKDKGKDPASATKKNGTTSTSTANATSIRRPAVVQVSIYLDNIESVVSSLNQWTGDVIATIRYQESDFPDGKDPKLMIYNGKTDAVTEDIRSVSNGVVTYTKSERVLMTFDGDFDIFPFDTQDFELQYILEGLTKEDAVFEDDPQGESGVHEFVARMGRRFTAAQFRVVDWALKIVKSETDGMSYSKSVASLSVRAKRYLPYYTLTCIALPLLPTLFAVAAFHLQLTPMMPRVMISFVAFLTLFVHLKQTMEYLPTGAWCWVMTELTFFCFILSVAITANIGSAVFGQHHLPLAKRHDSIQRWVLKLELLGGELLLLVFPNQHFMIAMYIVAPVTIFYHGMVLVLFWIEAKCRKEEKVWALTDLFALSFIMGSIPPPDKPK